jgi:uncharacterized 2Fe-2S/4Fe-4S cluster protein (DUF4445 family)
MTTGRPLYTITLSPSGEKRAFPAGTTLADALLESGVVVNTPCGGKGTCGKCRIRVEGMRDEVLACRTAIASDLEIHADRQKRRPSPALPEVRADARLALAVDIGTTTVKASLVDISGRAAWEIDTFFNPQQRFGHDVVSRIAAAGEASRRAGLQDLIRKTVSFRLGSLLESAGLNTGRIEKIVVAGNTTMLYLLFGMDPAPLGRHPYAAPVRDFAGVQAGEIGLDAFPSARVSAIPVLSAFIGADLVGGLTLCRGMGISRNALFLDLGTNGELFFLDRKGVAHAASCAMGPALEGMSISWGMTACDGAVTHVVKGPDGLGYEMIGAGEPAGITGTALIDLIAILLDEGIIAPGGALTGLPVPGSRLSAQGKAGRARQVSLWGRIALNQKDIRNVQLAKAASFAASRLLLETAGCAPEDVEHVLVAGSLGEHLDYDNFMKLGFIPHFPRARHAVLGNTSLKAAEAACMDPGFFTRATVFRDETREVVLSAEPRFQEVFLRSLEFPIGGGEREWTGS